MIKLNITVIPRSSRNRIKHLSSTDYKIWVTAVPEKGKANAQVIQILARHLDVSQSQLTILRGHRSNKKIVSVLD